MGLLSTVPDIAYNVMYVSIYVGLIDGNFTTKMWCPKNKKKIREEHVGYDNMNTFIRKKQQYNKHTNKK